MPDVIKQNENENEKTDPKESKKEASHESSSAEELIKKIDDMKQNTVSKELYEAEKETVRKLAEYVMDGKGENPLANAEKQKELSKDELKKILTNEDTNNLEYAKASLALRKKVMDEGGRDPFLPVSTQQPITSIDVEGAEKVAKVLQECVDEANGDPDTFTFLFGKRINETSPILNAKARKAAGKGK